MPDPTLEFADLSHCDQNQAVVGALRMALLGAADSDVALQMVEHLLEQAPATPGSDIASVRLFVDGIGVLGLAVGVPSQSTA